ncbi:MAG TPA: DsbC family protein [Pedomonas sp.]|uniref:DsbC family protein n=1 Tax=Pedomonas sp. TaxID=2976421 RepID=UPI002F3E5A95
MTDGQTASERAWASGATLRRGVVIATAGVVLGVLAGLAWAHFQTPDRVLSEQQITKQLGARLPKTDVTSVDCRAIDGLCEVVAGSNLFYTDSQARHLIIGRVYDLETRTDLTAARLLEVSPDTLARGGPRAGETARRAPAPARLDLESLPDKGLIGWGPEDGPRVAVFSDLACPYCRMLHQTLANLGARVAEYPIAILGSRALAEKVMCAEDPAKALAAVYGGDPEIKFPPRASCDTRLIDANEAFFQAQGWQGTPVLIRSDGQVAEGALGAEALKVWLAGGRA